MTDQGSDVGLITKTVEKVETKETPPIQPEAPPEPDRGSGKPRKRTLGMGAALLVVVLSLGLGYMFFLKQDSEPPANTPRRSISARKEPGRLVQRPAEAKQDAGVSTTDPSQKKGTPTQSSNKPAAGEGEAAEAAAASEAVTETLPAEEERSTQVSPAEEPGKGEVLPGPEDQEQISTDVASGEEGGTLPGEYMEDETLSLPPEELYSDEATRSYASDPGREWTQTAVEVTERSASRAERYYKKGASYQQQGKLSQAIESYREALTFDPDHLQAHVNLATAYLQTSRFREAEQELAYLYAVKPKDPKVLFNFGLLLYRTGEYVSAEAKLRKLLELDPFHLEANLLLASIYEERGGINKAVELCMRAYQINSAHPRVLYRLGRAWDKVGDSAEAAKYYQLYLSTRSEKEGQLELVVRDRLNYLLSQKEEK
ncbi:MAG: tetratricopeptide repeat protein [Candidatus Zixiibacteriota bacterium]